MSTAAQSGHAASATDDTNDVAAVFLSRPPSRLRSIAKQYDEAAQQTITHTDEPYKIIWGSRIFVIGGVLNKKKSRGRRSWITREGWFLTELTTTGKVKQDVWCCRRCDAYGKPQFYTLALWSDDEAELAHWRERGPVGKLHNVVKFIRASPQRSEAFRQHAKEAQILDDYQLSEEPTWDLGLKQNNSTRWNSTYLMIERAVRKRDDINSFVSGLDLESDDDKRIPDADRLTADDWKSLIEIKTILEPLYKLTMKTQGWGVAGTSGRLSDVLMGMEYILGHLEGYKTLYDNDPDLGAARAAEVTADLPRNQATRLWQLQSTRRLRFNEGALPSHARDEYVTMPNSDGLLRLRARERASIRASINNAWKKLDEYYTKLADSPLFTAAIILDPNLGLRWLRRRWRDPEQHEWLVAAKDGLKEYFERWYCSPDDPQPQGRSVCRDLGREDDPYEAFVNSRASSDEEDSEDEIDRYYDTKVGANVDSIDGGSVIRLGFRSCLRWRLTSSLFQPWQLIARGPLALPSLL